jgi:hypothetical protein
MQKDTAGQSGIFMFFYLKQVLLCEAMPYLIFNSWHIYDTFIIKIYQEKKIYLFLTQNFHFTYKEKPATVVSQLIKAILALEKNYLHLQKLQYFIRQVGTSNRQEVTKPLQQQF